MNTPVLFLLCRDARHTGIYNQTHYVMLCCCVAVEGGGEVVASLPVEMLEQVGRQAGRQAVRRMEGEATAGK
jgi:hypothetical protein